jgi:hypothetical protein
MNKEITKKIQVTVSDTIIPKSALKNYFTFAFCVYAGLLNKGTRLAAALFVKKFITIIAMYLSTLCCAT